MGVSNPIHRFSRGAGLFAVFVGTCVLIGWTLDSNILKGAGHRIVMKPNAALGLILCGIGLALPCAWGASRNALAIVAAAAASIVGALTLSEHIVGWDLGIDRILFDEPPGAAATMSPGRMGPNASTSMALTGIALIALRRDTRGGAILAQALALVTATFASFAVVGYVYGAQELYSAARYTAIAWPTALTFLVLASGVFFARTDVGPASIVVSGGPGGEMARRMLGLAIAVPVAFGYLRLLGERAAWYDTGLGTALIAVMTIVVFAVAIWSTAARLDATNLARAAAQRERDELLVRERSAREEAERANRLKDQFLATLSHELRTPLNVILGWADVLRSNSVPEGRRAQAAEVVVRNGKMLERLVEDLLDISRITNERVHLAVRPVDIVKIASAAIHACEGLAAQRGVRVVSRLDADSALVAGDPERLQQVVGNLLSNALKFTPSGGTVEVQVRVLTDRVELNVRDTGQGIHPQFLPHVFDRFRQEDSTNTREHGGLGLGLSIVRELTDLHGGSVTAQSDGPGRGSTFTVTLPPLNERLTENVS